MKKKLVFRTAKLLSDSRKRGLETGVAVAYEHQPKDQDEKKHGSLFAVIEISGSTSSSEEITELIIDAFHGEFYKDLDKDALESFEAALTKVNEKLADITEQGRINWLGKLNAILAVLSDKTLHVTQAGMAEAYLFRKENMGHVSKDLAGDSINPLRTFINIASGDLDEDDKVGFFSPGIFYHISKDELKKYITEFNPNTAVSHLANLLEGLNGQRRSSALIIEIMTPESLANYTIDTAPEEVWIQESKNGVEAITKGVSPIVLSAAEKSAGYYGKSLDYIKTIGIPTISSFLTSLIEKIKSLINNQKENVFLKPKEAISTGRFREEDTTEINEKVNLTERPERTSLVYSTFNKFSTASKKTAGSMKLPGKKNIKTILILGVISFLVIGTVFSISGKISGKKAEASKKVYEDAEQKFDEANALISANDKERGFAVLKDSKSLAEKAKDSKEYKIKAEELLLKITNKEDEALGIVKFEGEAFADLDKLKATGLLGIQKLGESFYSINSNTGAVYEINIENGESKEVVKEFQFTGKALSATVVDEAEKIAILTDEPAIYEFDPSSKEISKAKVTDLKKGTDIAAFGSNIYILDNENEAVYKHIKITGGYGKGTNYIQKATNSNAKNGVSIAIDGNVFILSENGDVTKFASGSQKDFSIKGLAQKLEGTNKIYANSDAKGLFFLDKNNKSIIVIDEKDNFVKQIKGNNFGDIKGIYVGENKVIYALSGTKIYRINQ